MISRFSDSSLGSVLLSPEGGLSAELTWVIWYLSPRVGQVVSQSAFLLEVLYLG